MKRGKVSHAYLNNRQVVGASPNTDSEVMYVCFWIKLIKSDASEQKMWHILSEVLKNVFCPLDAKNLVLNASYNSNTWSHAAHSKISLK